MEVAEINDSVIRKLDREETKDAVEITDANFHWGYKPEKPEDNNSIEKVESEKVTLLDTDKEEEKQMLCLEDFLALKEVNLKIKKGEFVCVIGDVGSGKSSLLSSIVGDLLYANSGFY